MVATCNVWRLYSYSHTRRKKKKQNRIIHTKFIALLHICICSKLRVNQMNAKWMKLALAKEKRFSFAWIRKFNLSIYLCIYVSLSGGGEREKKAEREFPSIQHSHPFHFRSFQVPFSVHVQMIQLQSTVNVCLFPLCYSILLFSSSFFVTFIHFSLSLLFTLLFPLNV